MSTKRSHILKQTCSFQLQVCLSMCDILVDIRHERVNEVADRGQRDSGTGVSLWILRNFKEHLFYRIPEANSFWKVQNWASNIINDF